MIAGLLSLLAFKLRQPLIIAYIVTGMLVGPGTLGFAQSMELFETMSSIGIAFLLFIVGLNLNWRNIAEVGRVALMLGFGQVLFTTAAGWLIGVGLGFDPVTALFLSTAFAFSSTIIIVKMLSDKEDIDRLYGRVAVGMLLVQDLLAMVLLLLLAAMQDGGTWSNILTVSFGKAIVAVVSLAFLGKFIVPHLFRFAARSTELLFLMAIAWCFAISSALLLLGFGIEIGALMAGVTLAGSGFQHEIEAKVRVLRDFFLVIFFIVLGTHLAGGDFGALLVPSVVFSLFILIGNPLLVLLIMRFMGYHARTGFLVGTTVAQISEFSFILIAGGVTAGLIDPSAMPLATVVGLATIAGSSYLISYNESIFDFAAKFLPFLRTKAFDKEARHAVTPQIILFGYDRMGARILPEIQAITKHYLVVDYNPAVIELLAARGVPCMYGDVGSEDVLHFIKADKAKMVISTVPDMQVNDDIMDYLSAHHFAGSAIMTVKSSSDAARCYALGATFVIVPSMLGGEHFANLLKKKKTTKTSWGTLAKEEIAYMDRIHDFE